MDILFRKLFWTPQTFRFELFCPFYVCPRANFLAVTHFFDFFSSFTPLQTLTLALSKLRICPWKAAGLFRAAKQFHRSTSKNSDWHVMISHREMVQKTCLLSLYAPVPFCYHLPTHTKFGGSMLTTGLRRYSRGMMPWSTSCSRVRLCWSLNCSTARKGVKISRELYF